MNKQQAAKFLGVSVRALERYVQQGRISVKYHKGKTRSTANFDSSERTVITLGRKNLILVGSKR